jgi:hypothetical protein
MNIKRGLAFLFILAASLIDSGCAMTTRAFGNVEIYNGDKQTLIVNIKNSSNQIIERLPIVSGLFVSTSLNPLDSDYIIEVMNAKAEILEVFTIHNIKPNNNIFVDIKRSRNDFDLSPYSSRKSRGGLNNSNNISKKNIIANRRMF